MKVSRAFVAMLAASLLVALAAAPSASAARADDSATAKKAQSTRTLNRRLNTTRRQVTSARRSLSRLNTSVAGLGRRLGSAEGGLGTILGAAPALINGLTQLGDAVRNQIAPGLTTVANTLRDTIGPGLTRLGDAYSAVEYGVAAVLLDGGSAGAIAAGGSMVSSDIPDDGNPAVVRGRTLIQSTGAGTIDFSLRALIRSNEGDNAAANTTGQAGGFATVKRVDPATTQSDANPVTTYNQAGVVQDCFDDDVTTGGAANQFVLGTPTGATIVTAAGNKTDLNLVNIGGGTPRTDTTGPTAGSANLFPAAVPTCEIDTAGAGELYEVDWTVNFLDIPTTTSPGPKD